MRAPVSTKPPISSMVLPPLGGNPSQEAPLDDWWVEIDLGRLVQAKNIRLTFPDTEGARPLREFSVFVTEGTPFLTGQDVFRYDRVGGTTQPSQETMIEYDLVTPELGNATGEHLATMSSDTLEYMSIQYVRVVAHAKSLNAALAAVEVEGIGDNIAPGRSSGEASSAPGATRAPSPISWMEPQPRGGL